MFLRREYLAASKELRSESLKRRKDNISIMKIVISGASARTGVVVLVVASSAGVSARVAGKVGGFSNKSSGKSTSGINEEIIWVSIGMAIAIAVLIVFALCYILHEKCSKRRAHREQS